MSVRSDEAPRCRCKTCANRQKKHESGNSRTNREKPALGWSDSLHLSWEGGAIRSTWGRQGGAIRPTPHVFEPPRQRPGATPRDALGSIGMPRNTPGRAPCDALPGWGLNRAPGGYEARRRPCRVRPRAAIPIARRAQAEGSGTVATNEAVTPLEGS